jgi:hypothetical protein
MKPKFHIKSFEKIQSSVLESTNLQSSVNKGSVLHSQHDESYNQALTTKRGLSTTRNRLGLKNINAPILTYDMSRDGAESMKSVTRLPRIDQAYPEKKDSIRSSKNSLQISNNNSFSIDAPYRRSKKFHRIE